MGYEQWTSTELAEWVSVRAGPAVANSFKENGVVGADLASLQTEDLICFGCTAFQAKKLQNELSKLGIQAAPGVPAAVERSGPPAGYPAVEGFPPAAYAPPVYAQMTEAGYGQPLYPTSAAGSQPMSPAGSGLTPAGSGLRSSSSKELDDLKAELARENMKNSMRQEMDTSARLAAMEAAARSASGTAAAGGAPVIVSNNMSSAHTAALASQAAAAAAAAQQATAALEAYRNTPQIIGHEKYCGACSWWIGCCLFPCICCCPVDTKPVYGIPAQQGMAIQPYRR